jgi:hypothetical protein
MKFKLLLIPMLFFACVSYGQSSVYQCNNTGTVGYCYGNNNSGNCAYNKCIESGGNAPGVIFTTSNKGYGAVALGTTANGKTAAGASGGFANKSGAAQEALAKCKYYGGTNCTLQYSWYDDPNN